VIRRAALALVVASALVRCTSSPSPTSLPPPTGDDAGARGADAADIEASPEASPEASCSTDIAVDPKNCGRCGHDCLGGACLEGLCQPVVLASNRGGPGSVAIDATHVYWLESSASMVVRVPKAGGPIEVLATVVGNAGAGNLRVDESRAYWADNFAATNSFLLRRSSVSKVPDAGAPIQYGAYVIQSGVGGPPTFVLGMALDGNDLLSTSGGGVTRSAKDSGAVAPVVNVPTVLTCLTADDAGLYVGSLDGQLLGVSPEGGTTSPIGTGLGDVEELLLDGADLFWIARGQGTIGIAKQRSSPSVFAGSLDDPRGVAVEDTSVYWTERDVVRSCPRSGCGAGPRVIAKLQARPMGIAVDATNLYWANGLGGTIVRLAK
jgi:hypothetical protein